MRVDSLVKLRSMVRSWRSQKKSYREPVPGDLLERVRRATTVHGVGAVIRATGIQHRHLIEKGGAKTEVAPHRPRKADGQCLKGGRRIENVQTSPSYSRIEFSGAPTRPLAEAETPSGVKVRLFAITPETIGLLSVLSGQGRAI